MNSRLGFPNAGFRNRCLQPLSHASVLIKLTRHIKKEKRGGVGCLTPLASILPLLRITPSPALMTPGGTLVRPTAVVHIPAVALFTKTPSCFFISLGLQFRLSALPLSAARLIAFLVRMWGHAITSLGETTIIGERHSRRLKIRVQRV